jgi:hypothetical protein
VAARAWAVLGLAAGASPLEVASAYVSLCEELDRELAAAPTEALRKRCLEARAEIDSAYQHCAAAPLAAEPAGSNGAAAGYETQVAPATFSWSRRLPTPRGSGSWPMPTRPLVRAATAGARCVGSGLPR